MSIDKLFEFYRDQFIPAYADLVGYIGDKPQRVINEIENVFTHVAQSFNPNISKEDQEKNITKAYDHMVRSLLDCVKSLWVEINDDIEKIHQDTNKRRFGINMREEEWMTQYSKFKKIAQDARKTELKNVGVNAMASIDKYREAILIGVNLLENVDSEKIKSFESFYGRFKLKVLTKEVVISVIAGLIAGFALGNLI